MADGRRGRLGALCVAWLALLLAVPSSADDDAGPLSVFDIPAMLGEVAHAAEPIRAGRPTEAIEPLSRLAERYPGRTEPLSALAIAAASAGETEAALSALERLAAFGPSALTPVVRSRPVQALGRADALGKIRAAAIDAGPSPTEEPAPSLIDMGSLSAIVTEANTAWEGATGVFVSRFEMPPILARRPAIGERGDPAIAPFLNRWYAQGRAAGNVGDLYDNRDRDHSTLPRARYPQLVHVEYAEAAKARGLDYGPNRGVEFDRITIGNSSTAIVQGNAWRSQTRQLLTEPRGADGLFRQYARNMVYVYPSKNDFEAKAGDTMPANQPYAITSLGISGSDKPFLDALAMTLAAFQPAVKARLAEEGLIAPMLQRIMRRALDGVESEADYLTAAAHPVVFDGARLDPAAMVKAAQGLTIEAIPPMVRLSALRETTPSPEAEIFAPGATERLFDTPSAIARVFRGTGHTRRYLLSARATRDLSGRPLRFVWRLLQGDPERVSITPQAEDGSVVEIEVAWHDAITAPGKPKIASRRVDVAAFAVTPRGHSAPAFFSVAFPPDQVRRYGADGMLLEVDYSPRETPYADPLVYPIRSWRDRYSSWPDGTPAGWTREFESGRREDYTARGERVLSRDAAGRPLEVETVRYVENGRDGRGRMRVRIDPGERLSVAYAGPDDLVGVRRPLP